ncbi:MAG: polysaccharide deacetylase family protein, partial [Bacteroidota bacterium]|nr:polysaccharide deacetylase family protein [Bacteroidota bacterium]
NRSRREFIRTVGFGTVSLAVSGTLMSCEKASKEPTHIISLSFDDGFEKSSILTAEIYEKYNLSACMNVIASAHKKSFGLPNEYHAWQVGDFDLWNDLQSRGHEIMPHSYRHANLTEMPLDEAEELIMKCLDVFSNELDDFKAEESIFNFPYNASNGELENLLKPLVRAVRTGGSAVNELPYTDQFRLTCTTSGPENIDEHLDHTISRFLELPLGWLIYNTHGLDDEGWGPLSSSYLDELLSRLTLLDHVAVLPVGKALNSI